MNDRKREKRLLPYHLLAQMGNSRILKNDTEIIANETAQINLQATNITAKARRNPRVQFADGFHDRII